MILINAHPQGDAAQRIRVTVDDGVGHRLTDGGADIPQFLQRGIHLRRKAGGGRTGKALIGRTAGKLQPDLVDEFHRCIHASCQRYSMGNSRPSPAAFSTFPGWAGTRTTRSFPPVKASDR